MNRLQKEARNGLWYGFFGIILIPVLFYFYITVLGVVIPKADHSKPAGIIILTIILATFIWNVVFRFLNYKKILQNLDERERYIYENARNSSNTILELLCFFALWVFFFWYEPQTPIPIIIPVLMYLFFQVIARTVYAVLILTQLKTERNDE